MSKGYVHSVKVPRIYKTAANTIKNVVERKASLKELIYERRHPNLKGVYALAATTIKHSVQLTEVLEKTELLKKEPRFDPWLARILITELIWGKQSLQSEAKPILTIKNYEKELRDALENTSDNKYEKSIKADKPRYVRVNTLIMSVDDAIEELQNDGFTLLPKSPNYKSYLKSLESLDTWSFIQDYHVHQLLAFKPGTAFYDHDGYKSGALVLQDKASCLPAYLLNPPPGSVVLDMCAAPGMKTTHLAAILNNKGKVYSIERDARRYQLLCKFIESSRANIVTSINADAMTIDSKKYPDIEYILVDPTCSGSGMDRPELDESTRKNDPARLKSLQSFQVFLLRHALLDFPKVKRVVYSTCSIYPEENEMVVDEVLGNIGEAYKLVPVRKLFDNQWINYSSNDFNCRDNCLYASPSVDYSNGFFVAVFERNFDVPLPEFKRFKTEGNSESIDERSNEKKKKKKNFEQGIEKNEGNGEEIGSKKNKKKKLIEAINNVDNGLNGEENCEEVDTKKKKKKKKKKENKNKLKNFEQGVENIEGNGEENYEEIGSKKKKLTEEINNEDNELNGEENCEEVGTKKKKKKNKLKNSEEGVENNEGNSEENYEEMGSKKKKKKKLTEEINNVDNGLNGEEVDTKKKKKKKKLLAEDKVEVQNEEIIEKVHKKKKKLKEESEVNIEQVEKKKKKKRKYDSVEDSTENNNSNEVITKKKKKAD